MYKRQVYAIGNSTVVLRRVSDEGEVWRTELINSYLPIDVQAAERVVLLAGDEDTVYAVARHPSAVEFQKRWLYALNRTNGEIKWSSRIPMRYYSASPVIDITVTDELVLVVDLQGGVTAFDKHSGDYAWSNILLGVAPYVLSGEYVPQAPITVLDDDESIFAGKSIPARVGIFINEELPAPHGNSYGLLQPVPTSGIPSGLEEYLPHCSAVSLSSRQVIVPFMSTSVHLIGGTWVGDEDFNAVYSFNLDSALSGGSSIDWNWRTRPFLWSDAITGCLALDSSSAYAVTRGTPFNQVKLLSCLLYTSPSPRD